MAGYLDYFPKLVHDGGWNLTGSLKLFYDAEGDYAQLLRLAIEEFRLLFVAWVKGFDVRDYIVDDWGLFNPPGIEP